MLKYFLSVALILTLAGMILSPALALQTGQSAPAFKLSDQFNKVWDSSALKGNIIVLVAANRDSGRSMGPWYDKLKAAYGGKIVLLGLMDLRSVPGIGRGIARSRIRKETKDPLMIDFQGKVADNYLVNSKNPVVIVINKSSVVKAVQNSPYSASAYAPISSAINAALE